jgi:hypothetical protein
MTDTLTKIQPEDYLRFNLRPPRESFTHGDIAIAGEELQDLGLCSALMAFEQGGVFIVPLLLCLGIPVFPFSIIRI